MFMFMLTRDEPASAAEGTQRNAGRRRLSAQKKESDRTVTPEAQVLETGGLLRVRGAARM